MGFRHFIITAVLAFSTLAISGKTALSVGTQGNNESLFRDNNKS